MKRHLFSIVTSSYLLVLPVVSAHGQPGFTPWAEATNLGATVNSAVTDQHPAISKKGLSLYFISNRAGGSGGQDIYVSQRENTEDPWGSPVNLGPNVNSASTENAPTLSRDGTFCSSAAIARVDVGAMISGSHTAGTHTTILVGKRPSISVAGLTLLLTKMGPLISRMKRRA